MKPKAIAVTTSALAIIISAFIHQQTNHLSNIPESKFTVNQRDEVKNQIERNRSIAQVLLIGGLATLLGSQFVFTKKEKKN